MKQKKLLLLMFCFILMVSCSAPISSYYVNTKSGDDANPWTLNKPFKSIERVNLLQLQAGNSLFFAGGQSFTGTLRLKGLTGKKEQPIVIGSYGNGRANINGENKNAIQADNCSWLEIKNLVVSGYSRLRNTGSGI